jgi:very-short-patch-repair endonuclease
MKTFGIKTYADLRADGTSRRAIDRAVAAGTVTRIARGWYAFPGADQQAVRAIQLGGRLGCLAGCRRYGLWVPPGSDPHVICGAGCTSPHGSATLHSYPAPQPRTPVWPLLECLDQVVQRHSTETALVVLESALHVGAIAIEDTPALFRRHQTQGSLLRKHLDKAESGSETRVRLFLQQRKVALRPQVEIDGVGRVDLLVGRSLIIECDSEEHHAGKRNYENDRSRDLAARDRGYDTLRLSYQQIWRQWAYARGVLARQIRLREHRDYPASGRPSH